MTKAKEVAKVEGEKFLAWVLKSPLRVALVFGLGALVGGLVVDVVVGIAKLALSAVGLIF